MKKTTKLQYQYSCDTCLQRLENCECEPGFPYGISCPIMVYDPDNHDPNCPFCDQENPERLTEVLKGFHKDTT